MLSLKKSFHLHLPHLAVSAPMQLSPVVSDSDELIQAIEEESIRHDNNWTLEAAPDSDQLDQSWDAILRDPE